MDKFGLELLGEILEQLKDFLPNLLFATIILIVGWLFSKVVAKVIGRVLKSIKIDDLAHKLNNIDIVRKTNLLIVPSTIISKVVYYVLMLMVLLLATDKLGVQAVTDLVKDIINYLPSLLSALLFFFIGLVVADLIQEITLTACQSLGVPSAKIISNIVFYFLFLSVTMSALEQAKISTSFINSSLTIIIAGIVSAFALGYGLASKSMMANYLASFYIKKRFSIGDTITIEGKKGQIEDIDTNSFVLKTEDSKIVFPLSKLASDQVELH